MADHSQTVHPVAVSEAVTNPLGLLTSEEVAERLGVPYRSLMRWTAEGLIESHAVGKGNALRLWSEKHLREARVVAQLRSGGVSMENVKKAADYLRSCGDNPFSSGNFLVLENGGEIVKIYGGGEIVALLNNPGQRMLVLVGLE
jgi:excisionase family DNA binding protein